MACSRCRDSKLDWGLLQMAEFQLHREISKLQSRYGLDQEKLRVILKYALHHDEISLLAAYKILYGGS